MPPQGGPYAVGRDCPAPPANATPSFNSWPPPADPVIAAVGDSRANCALAAAVILLNAAFPIFPRSPAGPFHFGVFRRATDPMPAATLSLPSSGRCTVEKPAR